MLTRIYLVLLGKIFKLSVGFEKTPKPVVQKIIMKVSKVAIQDISELDGFFAALVCATITIMPSVWVSAIWGGEHLVPQWESEQEITEFNQSIMLH
jgi:yecA family protein